MKLAYKRVYYDRGSDLDAILLVFWDEEKGKWITEEYCSMNDKFNKYLYAEPDPEMKAKYEKLTEQVNKTLGTYDDYLKEILFNCPICSKPLKLVKAKWVKSKLNAWGRDDKVLWCPNCRVTIREKWYYGDVREIIFFRYEKGRFIELARFVRKYKMFDIPPHEELKHKIEIELAKGEPLAEKIAETIPNELNDRIKWEEENDEG